MTGAEALQEARRRWGDHADVNSFAYLVELGERIPKPFIIYPGTADADGARWPVYSGTTWEAAFADADLRAERLLMGREP